MKNSEQIKIDFLGIGTQKSGTTWLYKKLNEIPEFNLPPIKEFHYFDRSPTYLSSNQLSDSLLKNRITNFKYTLTGLKHLLNALLHGDLQKVRFLRKWYFSNYNDYWYLSLFKHYNGYIGEITPSYSILKVADIKRMHQLAPNAKLILLLRNPIDRDWSNYRYSKIYEPNFSLKKVSNQEIINYLKSEAVTVRSNYIRTIDNFLNVFPKNQLLICFYDAIYENPEKFLNEIVSFIADGKSISIKHIHFKEIVNKAKEMNCPEEVEQFLKQKHYDQIRFLSNKYGGYFSKWYTDNYDDESLLKNKKLSPTIQL